ncbi:Hsp20/alpha crystallin family protein [Desulfoluna butyratoxydans]|uniref:Hsp20-like chaperone n=1 Tax=Desulfoluna butyratoxydans TaxID=231438 RepID=A0A4U8YJ70_9BACT|nr:Hsp20/alpha crystallin family protein [Desulfoluna butyratoxydans]VFQ43069.1 hsp20-like chaperone [Desulfoluna butyratoxydans]
MSDKERSDRKMEAHGDFGFGGLLKGLGNLIDAAAKLAETGEGQKRTGEFDLSSLDKIKGLKDIRGVYGINVRTLQDGSPVVQSFGNIKKSPKGPVVEEVREPIADLFEEEGQVRVVVEMPGVEAEEISVSVSDDILTIHAEGKNREYQKEVLLSEPAQKDQVNWTYKNGILEITLTMD